MSYPWRFRAATMASASDSCERVMISTTDGALALAERPPLARGDDAGCEERCPCAADEATTVGAGEILVRGATAEAIAGSAGMKTGALCGVFAGVASWAAPPAGAATGAGAAAGGAGGWLPYRGRSGSIAGAAGLGLRFFPSGLSNPPVSSVRIGRFGWTGSVRSEEHTPELQSPMYL